MRRTACGGSSVIEPRTSRCSAASPRARPARQPTFARRCRTAARLTPSDARTRSRAWPEALGRGSCNERRASWRRHCAAAIHARLWRRCWIEPRTSWRVCVAAIAGSLPPEATVARPLATIDRQALDDTVQRLDRLLSQDAVEALDVFDASQPLLAAAYGEQTGGNWPIAERLPVRGRPRGVARGTGGDVKDLAERLLNDLGERSRREPPRRSDPCSTAVKAHVGDAKQSDDISVVASRWCPSPR